MLKKCWIMFMLPRPDFLFGCGLCVWLVTACSLIVSHCAWIDDAPWFCIVSLFFLACLSLAAAVSNARIVVTFDRGFLVVGSDMLTQFL